MFDNKTLLMLVIFIFSISINDNTSAALYKCTSSNGSIAFQAIPCANGKKTENIKLPKRKVNKDRDCLSICERQDYVCTAQLEGTKGREVCQEENQACTVSCKDPAKGKYLKKIAKISRNSYQRGINYKIKMDKIDAEYKRKSIVREKKYNQEIKQIPCNSARERLDKLKSNWKNKSSYTTREEQYYRDDVYKAEIEVKQKCDNYKTSEHPTHPKKTFIFHLAALARTDVR